MTRVMLLLTLLAVAAPLSAVTMYGLRQDGRLIRFDSATPGTITDLGIITGFPPTDFPLGLDVRPQDGVLYFFTVSTTGLAGTYTLNPNTAVATLVGYTASSVAGLSSAASHGVGFNPTVDRVRVVNDVDENCRLNPLTGALAANDVDLSPSGVSVVAVAYDRSFAGTTVTTLYGLDAANDNLVLIGGLNGSPSPNGGVVTTVGSLGVNIGTFAGMDIDPQTGIAYGAVTIAANTSLCTINLATGAITLVGALGTGSLQFDSIAVASEANVAPTITAPSASTPANTNLVLTGNSITDADAGVNPIELQMVASSGTMTLNSTAGLTFVLGNGQDDIVIVCTGTVANLSAAFAGMTYKPATGFNGIATISISVADGGASGFGGPLSTNQTMTIAVGNVPSGGGGGDDDDGCSTSTRGMSWLGLAAMVALVTLVLRQRQAA